MAATACTSAVMAAIEKLIVQDRSDASSSDIVAAGELVSLRVWMQTNTANTKHSVRWPPYQSHALYALTTSSRLLSRYLLDFTPPGVILPQHLLESAETLRGLLADPKHSYDVAVASIRYWASYEPAFQSLFTLAVHNHHPSKIIFDPVTSPFSEDPIAAYNMGLYVRDRLGLLELAAQWFANSSDGEYPPGMFEYAKFLSSPGWAYHLSTPDTQVEVSPTSNGQKSPSSQIQTRLSSGNRQQDLLENSIDSSRAISLLHQSYALAPNPETAFCIGMLYLHAPPPRTAHHAFLGESKSSASVVPSAASSPIRSLLPTETSPTIRKPSEPLHVQTNLSASIQSQEWPETVDAHSTKIRTLTLHRDPVKAAEYLSLAIANAGTAIRNRDTDGPVYSPTNSDFSLFLDKRNLTSVAATAAFELAKLYLVIGGDEHSERAVNLLHGVATLTSGSDMEGSERMGIVATFLLGHCLKRGIGCSNKIKRDDEGDAWIRISNVKQAGVRDRKKMEPMSAKSSDLMNQALQLVLNENMARKSMAKAVGIIKKLVEQEDENMLNMYVLGVCHRIGVGGLFDAAKGEYWMNRAHATGGFVVPSDYAAIEACLADASLLNNMMDIFGASKTGGDGGIPVSPSVPGSATEENAQSAVSEQSAYSIASLPPLPSFYIVFQKPMADEQCPKNQYPPSLGPILSHWVAQEEDITIEDVIRTFDF
ncbi:hypothetical protein HDU80_004890 [Chytriomyces hyalinus]|nr:hypothetical protein HDU80_004890 [Chytriomyces hyalinus]